MNVRLNIFLIFLTLGLAAWSYYLYFGDGKEDLNGLIKRDGSAEYIGKNSNALIYDLNGTPQYSASAAEIKRFEQEGRTEFITPVVQVFNPNNGQLQWLINAEHADLDKEHRLHLRGNVVLSSKDSASQLQQIKTDRLTVDLNTQDVFSDSSVTSKGIGFVTSGTGLSGNLKSQVATLSKNVKTYLEPTIIQQPKKSSASPKTKD